ncbi:hypothetical protein [Mucilaginibacter segetis]|uniref:Uncharacterized protein n=1 Tax=Mucilaginibacter segetis TaxID=2793071 RepID=A0A934PQ08_9SPHI|nr:hypothetical protein [Mucilaginibacter segetis]MBK0378633.1 hypothetical protein [Mucilaginibacter segetis]
MKTIKIDGNPETMRAVMIPRTDIYKEHDTIRLESTEDGHETVEKTIFRIVDAGEDKLELQFE